MQHFTTVAAALALAGYAVALPSYVAEELEKRQEDHHYDPAPANAVRAPCPGMSTLANHGFINRDGRNITAQALQQGFLDAFGMAFDTTDPGANNALTLCGSLRGLPNGAQCDSFDLDQMSTPHQIEHDASLTRNDKNTTANQNGDNTDFADDTWSETVAFWGGATHIDVGLANTARLGRINEAMSEDTPGWFVENDGGSLTEHGFYLTTMNDPTNEDAANPQARLDWMDHWFRSTELPTALGWVKPTSVISNAYLQSIVASVSNAPTVATPPPGPAATAPQNAPTSASAPAPAAVKGRAILGGAAATRSAVSSAQSQAGPKPSIPNAYVEHVSPAQWANTRSSIETYLSKVSGLLGGILGGVL